MNRRGFFGTVLGGFVAAILPWPKPVPPAHVMYWLNGDGMILRVSNEPTYCFGFSGFKEGDQDKIKGVISKIIYLTKVVGAANVDR